MGVILFLVGFLMGGLTLTLMAESYTRETKEHKDLTQAMKKLTKQIQEREEEDEQNSL